MKLRIEKSVVVITPTIGSPKVKDAVESVRRQTYGNVTHLIVVDGADYFNDTIKHVPIYNDADIQLMCLPWNTGANGFNGQRIYASIPHLVNHDYVFFLDQDNWYEPNHVESLVQTIEDKGLQFAYSLRNVFDGGPAGPSVPDNCESLGKWPIYFTTNTTDRQYLVDTSAFAFTRYFIQQACHLYHSGAWGEDRRFLQAVGPLVRWDTSGLYTLGYRTGGNEKSVNLDFFIKGNEETRKFYKDGYPWQKT